MRFCRDSTGCRTNSFSQSCCSLNSVVAAMTVAMAMAVLERRYPLVVVAWSTTITTTAGVFRSSFSSVKRRGHVRFSPTKRWLSHSPGSTTAISGENSSTASIPSINNNNSQKIRLSFLTDVEGDRSYFDRFVETSEVLAFADSPATSASAPSVSTPLVPVIFVDDDGVLVVGGDTWDKGGNDLYVTRQLLDLYGRYPDRVHLLLGNRDVNKMRLCRELSSSASISVTNQQTHGQEQEPHPGMWWLRGTGIVGDPTPSSSNTEGRGGSPPPTDVADRLRWMLGTTMGSPNAFELRRAELAEEMSARSCKGGDSGGNDNCNGTIAVDDDAVVESYLRECSPEGLMGRYLQAGQLAVKVGGALFMHGSLPITDAMAKDYYDLCQIKDDEGKKLWWRHAFGSFLMPWKNTTTTMSSSLPHSQQVRNLEEWIDALNSFARSQIRDWVDHFCYDGNEDSVRRYHWAEHGGYESALPGTGMALVQYCMGGTPDRSVKNPTVVYSSWVHDGTPKLLGLSPLPASSAYFQEKKMYEGYSALVRRFFLEETKDAIWEEEGGWRGVECIVTGHRPHGDLPLPMRISLSDNENKDGFDADRDHDRWVLSADTSYSGDVFWADRDIENLGRGDLRSFRGAVAVSELILDMDRTSGRLSSMRYHGVLSDGSRYISTDLLDDDRSHRVGRPMENIDDLVFRDSAGKALDPYANGGGECWWVKGRLCIRRPKTDSGDEHAEDFDDAYVVTTSRGFDVTNAVAVERE